MAQSFWSKRKNNTTSLSTNGETVSRPVAMLMTVLGILIVGGLFFGVFWGARWGFEQLSNSGSDSKPSNAATDSASSTNSNASSTNGGAVTETSSTATTTPSAPKPVAVAPTPAPTTTNASNLPHTGPESTTAFFMVLVVVGYIAYLRKQLKA